MDFSTFHSTLAGGMAEPKPKREFTRVRGPLDGLLARYDPEGRIRVYRLWDFWDEVVGEAIAGRARPYRLNNGVLMVQVSSHTWMQELQFMKEEICGKLNARLEAPLIRDLHFVPGRWCAKQAPKPPAPPPVVAVPELPSTGVPEQDAVLQRIAYAAAVRRASEKAPAKKKRR